MMQQVKAQNAKVQKADKAPPIKPVKQAPVMEESTGETNHVWTRLAQSGKGVDAEKRYDTDVNDSGDEDLSQAIFSGMEPSAFFSGMEPSAFDNSNSCSSPEEQMKINRFRARDYSLQNFTPSTGVGKFDAYYRPKSSTLLAKTKLHFNFVPADNTPGPKKLEQMVDNGEDVSRFFWSEPEKQKFQRDFEKRTTLRWSNKFTFRSKKNCWGFIAKPTLKAEFVDKPANSHFNITVHKSSGKGFDYKSEVNMPSTPKGQGSGKFWSSDARENPSYNSTEVARSERQRIERAIASTMVSTIQFKSNSAVASSEYRKRLSEFAKLLKQKNPSDPAIPLLIDGYASMEGGRKQNIKLSRDRALAVRKILKALGVTQPMYQAPIGPEGSANDASMRKVTIAPDTAFENNYSSNNFSAAEHEFGHFFGLPDEYKNNTGKGREAQAQRNFIKLVQAAGLKGPSRWGDKTTSQMSAGVDILPRHYVTLWEALGKMTSPDITQSQWKIV